MCCVVFGFFLYSGTSSSRASCMLYVQPNTHTVPVLVCLLWWSSSLSPARDEAFAQHSRKVVMMKPAGLMPGVLQKAPIHVRPPAGRGRPLGARGLRPQWFGVFGMGVRCGGFWPPLGSSLAAPCLNVVSCPLPQVGSRTPEPGTRRKRETMGDTDCALLFIL